MFSTGYLCAETGGIFILPAATYLLFQYGSSRQAILTPFEEEELTNIRFFKYIPT